MDVKALHLTVGIIAAFAILVTFKQNWVWILPEGVFVAAAFFFYLVFKPRRWEVGPDPDYFEGAGMGPTKIKRMMAAQVLWDADWNVAQLFVKSRYLKIGHWLLGAGMALTFLVGIIER